MGSLNSHTHLNGNADRLLNGKTGLSLNIFFEGDAFYQLHNDIVDAVFFPHIIYVYNIGMGKPGSRLGLHSEFGYEIGILTEFLL